MSGIRNVIGRKTKAGIIMTEADDIDQHRGGGEEAKVEVEVEAKVKIWEEITIKIVHEANPMNHGIIITIITNIIIPAVIKINLHLP